MSAYDLLLALILLALVVVAIVLFHPLRRSSLPRRPPAASPLAGAFSPVDDRYWSGGIFYNNPDDPAVFVPKRFGLGWTVNIGHPQGRMILIGMLLLPVVVALLGVLFPGLAGSGYGCHPSGCHLLP